MAAYEIYDYVSAETPDYSSVTLSLSPNEAIVEEGEKNVAVHEYDDGSESAVVLSSNSIFYLTFKWLRVTASEVGEIVDMYFNSSKANGRAKSFKLDHYDGHTYVVKFAEKLRRDFGTFTHGATVKFKVIGRINDA